MIKTSSQQLKSNRKKENKQNDPAPTSLTGAANVKCVLAGIDTIEINYDIESWLVKAEDWDTIEQLKEVARSTINKKDKANFTLAGTSFEVNRVGTAHYEYILRNADMLIELHRKIEDSKYYPVLRLRLSSEFLWSNNFMSALNKANEFVSRIAVQKDNQVSRVDLTADFEGVIPELDLAQFVTYAKKKTIKADKHYNGHNLTGYVIGKSPMECRIYNKTEEMEKSHKEWFMVPWRLNGWTPGTPVTRYEFQLGREVLKELKINTINDLIAGLGGLWKYCTTNWITIRGVGQQGGRSNPRTWNLTQFWEAVQSVTFGADLTIERLRVRKCKIDALKKGAEGYMVSIGAYHAVNRGHEVELSIYWIKRWLHSFIDSEDFKIRIIDRSFKLSELELE